jgi:hypothetical protein
MDRSLIQRAFFIDAITVLAFGLTISFSGHKQITSTTKRQRAVAIIHAGKTVGAPNLLLSKYWKCANCTFHAREATAIRR